MEGKRIVKRIVIFPSMLMLLLFLKSSNINKRNKEFFIKTTKIEKGRIEYNSGIIYIGDEEYLSSITNLNNKDLLVLDNREEKDPNIKIYDSFKIIDYETMEEVVESLLLYEKAFPTDWDRTKMSLIREWRFHNFMYLFGYYHNRTTDVDLNNKDEIMYCIRKK